MKKLIVHLISDSSGQTVKHAARSALSQFPEIEPKIYNWLLVRNSELLNEVISKIEKRPGIVLYTISNPDLREILKKFCRNVKIPCISVVGRIVKEISAFVDIGAENGIKPSYKLDESYFDKVEAIDFSLRHDDGQMSNELDESDIILIGASRTSKTPTSVYLAYNGFKTANVPFIYGQQLPESLLSITHPLVIGLVINPTRLIEIRETRMNLLQITERSNYTDYDIVQEEYIQVKRLCSRMNWPIIDVSRKSIEETAASVMKIYYDRMRTNLTNIL